MHTISFIVFQIYMIIVNNKINNVAYLISLIILAVFALFSTKMMENSNS
jgi:hypothetical protein